MRPGVVINTYMEMLVLHSVIKVSDIRSSYRRDKKEQDCDFAEIPGVAHLEYSMQHYFPISESKEFN